jgi:ribosomal protein L32
MKFSTVWDMQYYMKSNGLYCGINTPDALVSKKEGEEEFKHGLPPYAKRKCFLVDEYPSCPDNWMRSEGKLTSYFVPVQEGRGLWLDFNANWNHKHHVAIVISVQGINPITGLPCNDAHLEQYIEECPKCKEKFGPNRFCKTCGHIWPKQNYISTTGTNLNQLWLDGFRTAEGIVRQYILTQEKMKGVASSIIGKDRVYAIGISFFLSKERKPEQATATTFPHNYSNQPLNSFIQYVQPQFYSPICTPVNWQIRSAPGVSIDEIDNSYNTNTCKSSESSSETFYSEDSERSFTTSNRSRIGNKLKTNSEFKSKLAEVQDQLSKTKNDPNLQIVTHFVLNVEKLEVGAGANINQVVADDPESLDFWKSEPESILIVNYCNEEDCIKILQGGKVSLKGHKEGFLKEVVVGN